MILRLCPFCNAAFASWTIYATDISSIHSRLVDYHPTSITLGSQLHLPFDGLEESFSVAFGEKHKNYLLRNLRPHCWSIMCAISLPVGGWKTHEFVHICCLSLVVCTVAQRADDLQHCFRHMDVIYDFSSEFFLSWLSPLPAPFFSLSRGKEQEIYGWTSLREGAKVLCL